jgi:hypothetical protein
VTFRSSPSHPQDAADGTDDYSDALKGRMGLIIHPGKGSNDVNGHGDGNRTD